MIVFFSLFIGLMGIYNEGMSAIGGHIATTSDRQKLTNGDC